MTNRILKLREASGVRRCHTLPHVGEYTVGKHSYDAVQLLLAFNPQASRELIVAVLNHDLAERWVGDLPAPLTWDNTNLGKEYKAAQVAAEVANAIDMPALSYDSMRWLKIIDKLELWCWCKEQQAWGNPNMEPALVRLEEYLFQPVLELPESIRQFMVNYKFKRTS